MQDVLLHNTVMLNEAVDALAVQPDGHYIDATFGRGGHSRLVLSRLGAGGLLTVFDKDPLAIAEAQSLGDARVSIRHEGFAHLSDLPAASADGLLMDLGVSSPQIDDPQRGFSFRNDGPLDMRMDPTRGQSVAQWLATADVPTITEVIRSYGEDRFAPGIARAIERWRNEHGPLQTTAQLAELVAHTVKSRPSPTTGHLSANLRRNGVREKRAHAPVHPCPHPLHCRERCASTTAPAWARRQCDHETDPTQGEETPSDSRGDAWSGSVDWQPEC